MKTKTVDLSKYSMPKAKKMMVSLTKNNPNIKYHFILPSSQPKKSNINEGTKRISIKCPQCNSQLISTEDAIVCSSSNIKLIVADIKATKERYGDAAGLWLGKTAYRFLEQFEKDPENLKCDFYEKKR